MSVKINISPTLYHFTNGLEIVQAKGETVGQCLNELVAQFTGIKQGLFDKQCKLLNYVDVYVNGESTYPEELARLVAEGDEIHIVSMLGGG